MRPSEGNLPLAMWAVTCWEAAGPPTKNEPSKRKAGSWRQGQRVPNSAQAEASRALAGA